MSSAPQYKRGLLKNLVTTAWKVSKFGVFSGPYFPVFGLNTKINSINIRKSPYSVWKQENTDQKKICIWTLLTQCTPAKIKEHHVVAATTITCNNGTIQPTLSRVEIYGNYNTGNKVIAMSPPKILTVNETKINCTTIKNILKPRP